MAVIKLFKALLRFVNVEYYRSVDSATEGLEMASRGIVDILYVIDILNYTIIQVG